MSISSPPLVFPLPRHLPCPNAYPSISNHPKTPTPSATSSSMRASTTLAPNVQTHTHVQTHTQVSQIKTIVTNSPTILCSNPEKTLAPNLRALQDMGLSAPTLKQIILSASVALQLSEAVPRVNFWRDFVGGEEETLVKVLKRNRGLIGSDTSGGIAAKLSLLRNHGISTQDIRWIVCTVRCFITSSVSLIDDVANRTKELGFQPESAMFKNGIKTMAHVGREVLQKKMELFKSFGWSEKQFLCALHKAPSILHLAEDHLRAKMDFLVEEANCDISYIVGRPNLILYSLEKRLRPRHHVLRVLKSNDLTWKKDFAKAISIKDSIFVAKYILPHKDEIPGLYEAYHEACAS